MEFSREQFIELMTFGRAERPMFTELYGLLVGLEDEWRAQGATPSDLNLAAFDWDYAPHMDCGAHTGMRGGLPTVTIEENDEYLIQRDGLGRTMKLCKRAATIPLPLDFPVKDMDTWLKIKPMFTFHPDRIDWGQVEAARKEQARGVLVTAAIPGAFYLPRELMGDEAVCIAYYDQPELIRDILQTAGDTAVMAFERVTEKLVIDVLCVAEDLAGKSGPLAGPSQVAQFIKPYYRRVWDLVSSRGTKLFGQDSDGNLNAVIDNFLDAGLNIMFPMEPAAGMDIVSVRKKHEQRLALMGGIDKHVLRQDKAAIRRELEYKMQPSMRRGMVFALDSRIPNGTPLENYRYYVQAGREILGLPPLGAPGKPFRRMAL